METTVDNDLNFNSSSSMTTTASPIVRGTIARCLRIRTVAEVLPSVLRPVVTSGKLSVMVFAGSQLVLLLVWLPFRLLSLAVSEWGVYLSAVCAVILAGRAIIRMIAFPGSSHRISNEIEKEFAKYSVRIITSSATSLIDLATDCMTNNNHNGSASGATHELLSLWRRAKSYRDRVLGVYCEVLHATLQDGASSSSSSSADVTVSAGSNKNKYGNNSVVGDVGNLSGLTPEAIADGRALLHHLETVLSQVDALEPFLENPKSSQTATARQAAMNLVDAATELKDFVESLKPVGNNNNNAASSLDSENNQAVDELRSRLEEEQTGSIMDTIRLGAASILPKLDPPRHTSIFGIDVLRGCVLSRYKGARQLWVPRSGGGMIDCLHIPAKSNNSNRNNKDNVKAVLYCNPNAGLIEVATGMSVAGGNVSSDADGVVNDNCWTDFYTNAGFDMYLFNYAGFGRSYGTVYCGLCNGRKNEIFNPSCWGRLKRIGYGLFFGFRPTPDTLRADGLAVANHVLSQMNVQSLVHGESIGGLAASHTARRLTENILLKDKVSLLLCDRTFCNLEATAQRLVGGWSGYAIRMLAPFWSTDILGDFLAASCPKVVATDSADAIIADSSSLRAGIAFWKEIKRSASTTKGIGWITDAPIHYRMADWENVSVTESQYVPPQPRMARMTAPVWPADKHISLEEAFHFAACAKRIGKLASLEKKRFAVMASAGMVGSADADGCQVPIYLIWKYLGCCEGLCGAPLGVSVKGGFDTTVSWLCSMCVFGGQAVVEGIEHRHRWTSQDACSRFHELGPAEDTDFDCRPPDYESQESDTVVHPKPIPEVVEAMQIILEQNADDEILDNVRHEVAFVLGTLEYMVSRLSAPTTIETSWKCRHLKLTGPSTEGSFMNLHCGHNNPFSSEERKRLNAILEQLSSQTTPSSSLMLI